MKNAPQIEENALTDDPWDRVAAMMRGCMQCGSCTGSCPNAFAMDCTPRSMWKLVLAGRKEDVFRSRAFSVCSSCYTCMLRCPRELPLTEAMAALKRIAIREKDPRFHACAAFYTSFLRNVEKRGRLAEMQFLTSYFLKSKNPLASLRFASLGARLFKKGKIHVTVGTWKGDPKLSRLFALARELEDR